MFDILVQYITGRDKKKKARSCLQQKAGHCSAASQRQSGELRVVIELHHPPPPPPKKPTEMGAEKGKGRGFIESYEVLVMYGSVIINMSSI